MSDSPATTEQQELIVEMVEADIQSRPERGEFLFQRDYTNSRQGGFLIHRGLPAQEWVSEMDVRNLGDAGFIKLRAMNNGYGIALALPAFKFCEGRTQTGIPAAYGTSLELSIGLDSKGDVLVTRGCQTATLSPKNAHLLMRLVSQLKAGHGGWV